MTIFTDGLRQSGGLGIHQLDASLGESLGATAGDAFESLPLVSLMHIQELSQANGELPPTYSTMTGFDPVGFPDEPTPQRAGLPEVPIDQAKARVKEAGLDKILHMPDQPTIKTAALDIMLDRARARRERQATIERGPGGIVPGALNVGTSLLVSAIDPLNVAAAFIPVVGEARYAKLMADAGASVIARAAVRAGVGAASGAVGMAAIEPIEYAARNQEGQDYTFVDALRSVMYGALLGGSLHTAGGGIADVLRARKGNALYPFGEGEAFAPGAAPAPGAGVRQTAPGRGDAVAKPGSPLSEAPIGETPKVPTTPIASRATPQARPQSLLEFIAKQGGISDQDPLLPDLLQSFGGKIPTVPGSGKLVRAGGKSLDNLREAAVESGYLHDAAVESGGVTQSSIEDLLRAVDAEARGQKQYRAGETPAPTRNQLAEDAARSHEARIQSIKDRDAAFETALDDHEVGDRRGEVKVRARLLMEQDGLADPEAAIAQALSDMGIRQAQHPVMAALNDLPPRAREDALRGAIAALHDGEPVRVGEMFEAAARNDPRMVSLSAAARDWPDLPKGARFDGNGDHGPIIDGLQDRWRETVDWLSDAQAGDARGVLEHPDVPGGRIDVVWGKDGAAGYGLAHIVERHPEVITDLPDRLATMRKVDVWGDRIQLESPDGLQRAAVSTTWAGEHKVWLLTAFEKGRREGEGGPGSPPGLKPSTDVQPSLSRYYGEEAGPTRNIGEGARAGNGDADFRTLAERKPDFDEAGALEASRAAERLAEPPSIAGEPSARVAAAERALAEADADYKANEAYIPEDLRAQVERDVAALELEAKDHTEVIQRGAACLAAAMGSMA